MRLTTGKDPCSVLNELRNILLPGKKHTRVLPFIFPRRYPEEKDLNANGTVVGEVFGDRFWLMYSNSSIAARFLVIQYYFSGKVKVGKNRTVIRGHFLPQPSLRRLALITWSVMILGSFALAIAFGPATEANPAATAFVLAMYHVLDRFMIRLFSQAEERKVRKILRRIASEEGEGSCAS